MSDPATQVPDFPLVFERTSPGRRGWLTAVCDVPATALPVLLGASNLRARPPRLPELSEVDVVRHYTALSRRNFGVDQGFYPLGSCTMKYNPKINDAMASLPGFRGLHPLQPDTGAQGVLELLHELTTHLCELTGMTWGTLQPFAGAHGEFTGMKLFQAYFTRHGQTRRRKVLVPDSSHGTNPASAHLAGFDVVEIKSDERGLLPMESLKPHLDDTLAGIMLTNPNTLGLFEEEILPIARAVHEAGGLLYYDGANLNAIVGKVRPGDMGFDVVHLNLHKTFSTPHGGGGPGAGPVLVGETLLPFLPVPDIRKGPQGYTLVCDRPDSIGRVAAFHGNVGVLIRAYTYILTMGRDGLRQVAERAVLNANYVRQRLKGLYDLPYDRLCKHEMVFSARSLKDTTGVSALDIAKRLVDLGVHPPTIYFPLIVPEALMIEPTETESRETLDAFIELMRRIHKEARESPQVLKEAPTRAAVRRIDEVQAARHPVVRWTPEGGVA